MTEVQEQDPTVQRRRLRAELRNARDTAGLRQADVAQAMDWSLSKLMRIERGEVNVSTNDLKALLSHYGVKDKVKLDGLLELARSARAASFYDQYAGFVKPGFAEYLAYEASASVIRQYDPVLIPGLLQTEEYARGLFEGMSRSSQEAADKGWAVRQHRQEVFDRDRPPQTLFILDEAALRRRVGRGNAMSRQLKRIQELAAEPRVSIQVIPFAHGAHPGMSGNFILLEFADPNLADLAHLENIDSITIRDDTELIARYLDRFDQLQKLALSPDESVDFLDVLIGEMSPTDQPTNSTHKEAI
ncbi:MAG: helix-turn-helix domain-containing protein [Pseudonocardiaceae bacterium]